MRNRRPCYYFVIILIFRYYSNFYFLSSISFIIPKKYWLLFLSVFFVPKIHLLQKFSWSMASDMIRTDPYLRSVTLIKMRDIWMFLQSSLIQIKQMFFDPLKDSPIYFVFINTNLTSPSMFLWVVLKYLWIWFQCDNFFFTTTFTKPSMFRWNPIIPTTYCSYDQLILWPVFPLGTRFLSFFSNKNTATRNIRPLHVNFGG